ncbi:MAG: hypothetical protein ACHQRK_04575, partial [Gemmatimonadales bacterium]
AHSFGLAMAYTGLGDRDSAFESLDRAHAERDAFLHTIMAMPAFEPLQVDARWAVLLARIGLGKPMEGSSSFRGKAPVETSAG